MAQVAQVMVEGRPRSMVVWSSFLGLVASGAAGFRLSRLVWVGIGVSGLLDVRRLRNENAGFLAGRETSGDEGSTFSGSGDSSRCRFAGRSEYVRPICMMCCCVEKVRNVVVVEDAPLNFWTRPIVHWFDVSLAWGQTNTILTIPAPIGKFQA